MININCSGCNNHCCGKNPYLTPILLPSEKKRFEKHSKKIITPHREMFLLAKKKNGNCIFLDDKTINCTIYDERPLECRLYPFLLDFSEGKPDVKLDKRFCPHLSTLKFDKEKILEMINKNEFTKVWILAYDSLQGKY